MLGCRGDDLSMLSYGLLACSSFDAQPCDLRLLHAAIKGGKVTKAGEQASVTAAAACLLQ